MKENKLNAKQLKDARDKLQEFFEVEFDLCERSTKIVAFIVDNREFILKTGISEEYLNQIIEAYQALQINPYDHLYFPYGKKFIQGTDILRKEELSEQDIEYFAETIRTKNRSTVDNAMATRLAALAFITLHETTILKFLTDIKAKEIGLPKAGMDILIQEIQHHYSAPVQRPTRLTLLFKDLIKDLIRHTDGYSNEEGPTTEEVKSWDVIRGFNSMFRKYENFSAEIELLIDIGLFMPEKEGLSKLITLEHLKHIADLELGFSVRKSLEEDAPSLTISFINKLSPNTSDLEKSISFYTKSLQDSTNPIDLSTLSLPELVDAFKGAYQKLNTYDNQEIYQTEIANLKALLALIVQAVLSNYLKLFSLNVDDITTFQNAFLDIQTALRELKKELVEDGCPLGCSQSIRTIKAVVSNHLDHKLKSFAKRSVINKDVSDNVLTIRMELTRIFGDDFVLGGEDTDKNYFVLTVKGVEYGIQLGADVDVLQEEYRLHNQSILEPENFYGYHQAEGDNTVVGFNIIPHYQGNHVDQLIEKWSAKEKLTFLKNTVEKLQVLEAAGIIFRDLSLKDIIYDIDTGQVKFRSFQQAILTSEVSEEIKERAYNEGISSLINSVYPELNEVLPLGLDDLLLQIDGKEMLLSLGDGEAEDDEEEGLGYDLGDGFDFELRGPVKEDRKEDDLRIESPKDIKIEEIKVDSDDAPIIPKEEEKEDSDDDDETPVDLTLLQSRNLINDNHLEYLTDGMFIPHELKDLHEQLGEEGFKNFMGNLQTLDATNDEMRQRFILNSGLSESYTAIVRTLINYYHLLPNAFDDINRHSTPFTGSRETHIEQWQKGFRGLVESVFPDTIIYDEQYTVLGLDIGINKLKAKQEELDFPRMDPRNQHINRLINFATQRRQQGISQAGEVALTKTINATTQFLEDGDEEVYNAAILQAKTDLESFPWLNLVVGIMLAILCLSLLAGAALLIFSLLTPAAPVSALILTPIIALFTDVISFISANVALTAAVAAQVVLGTTAGVGIFGGAVSGLFGAFFIKQAVTEEKPSKIMGDIKDEVANPAPVWPVVH